MNPSMAMNHLRRPLSLALALAGGLAVFAGDCRGQDAAPLDPTLQRAVELYAPDSWQGGARRAGFVLEDFEPAGLAGRPIHFRSGDVSRVYRDKAGVPRVLIEMSVGESIADAHAALLRHVAYVQSPKTLPTAESQGIRAGDVGYVGFGGRDGSKICWLAFAAGNLEFRVKSLAVDADGAVDVRPIVEALAARVLAQPELEEGAAVPKPTVEQFAADGAGPAAGESAVLELLATDPTGRAPQFSFDVQGEGRGYVEQDDFGAWRFHATRAGRATIVARVLGRNGTTATAHLELDVAAK